MTQYFFVMEREKNSCWGFKEINFPAENGGSGGGGVGGGGGGKERMEDLDAVLILFNRLLL